MAYGMVPPRTFKLLGSLLPNISVFHNKSRFSESSCEALAIEVAAANDCDVLINRDGFGMQLPINRCATFRKIASIVSIPTDALIYINPTSK